jgi:thiamine transport system substrate-binding protein
VPESAEQFALDGDGADQLTPIDYSDVCVNVDDTWFAKRKVAPPATLDDLTRPEYKDLFVTPGATTSSPGLAFLLATISAKGEGWQEFWTKLVDNGVKVTNGWTDAYEVDFTAGGGNGDRPIVTSYSSSPPFTIAEGETRPPTRALLDTCFRQVEYAGVLKGSENPKGMQKFIDFMLDREFQAAIPDNMYVYPIDRSVPLPKTWAKYAPVAPNPLMVDPDEVSENRAEWLREWRDITSQ